MRDPSLNPGDLFSNEPTAIVARWIWRTEKIRCDVELFADRIHTQALDGGLLTPHLAFRRAVDQLGAVVQNWTGGLNKIIPGPGQSLIGDLYAHVAGQIRWNEIAEWALFPMAAKRHGERLAQEIGTGMFGEFDISDYLP